MKNSIFLEQYGMIQKTMIDKLLTFDEIIVYLKIIKKFCKYKYKKEDQYHFEDCLYIIDEYVDQVNMVDINTKDFRKYLENNH